MRAYALTLVYLLTTGLLGCGDSDDGTSAAVAELRAIDLGRYLDVVEPDSTRTVGAWTEYHYDPAKKQAICFSGLPYQINLRPGSTNKVLLYLEGGGACWNARSCYNSPLAKSSANGALVSGVIDNTQPENPFRDWHVVYVPYCDGSVFGGDSTVDYSGRETYHHGLINVSAAVTMMRRAFPDPEQIVVAGSSAGGYGTFSGYGVTRVAYPDSEILVLNDSGPGLQNPAEILSVQERLTNWKFREQLPPSCTNCEPQITYLSEWALQRDPQLRVAYFNYLQDGVLQFFLNLDAEAFAALYLEITGDLRSRQPQRFKRFLPLGVTHTILLSSSFYSESVNGIAVKDWTRDFLVDGPAWQDTIEQ